jgi:hypothetical protein
VGGGGEKRLRPKEERAYSGGESRKGGPGLAWPWNRFRLLWRCPVRRLSLSRLDPAFWKRKPSAFSLQPSTSVIIPLLLLIVLLLPVRYYYRIYLPARTTAHSHREHPLSRSCSLRKPLRVGYVMDSFLQQSQPPSPSQPKLWQASGAAYVQGANYKLQHTVEMQGLIIAVESTAMRDSRMWLALYRFAHR